MESSFDKSFRQRLKEADIPTTAADWADMERLLDSQTAQKTSLGNTHNILAVLFTLLLILAGGRLFTPPTELMQIVRDKSGKDNGIPSNSISRQSIQPQPSVTSAGLLSGSRNPNNVMPVSVSAVQQTDYNDPTSAMQTEFTASRMQMQPSDLSSTPALALTDMLTADEEGKPFRSKQKPRIKWAISAATILEATLHNRQHSLLPAHRSGVLVHMRVGKYTEFSSGLLAGQTSIAGRYTSPSSGQSVTYRNQLSECVIPLGVTFLPVQKGRWAMTLSAGINQHVKLSEEIRLEDTEGQRTDWSNTFQPEPVQTNQATKTDLPGVNDMVLSRHGRYYISGWISGGMRVRLSSILSLHTGFTGTLRPGLKGISGSIWGVGGQLGIIARF